MILILIFVLSVVVGFVLSYAIALYILGRKEPW